MKVKVLEGRLVVVDPTRTMPSEHPKDGRCGYPLDGEDVDGADEHETLYCLNYPEQDDDGDPIDGYCWTHPEDDRRTGGTVGPPEGSQNALGNDGGAPEGHTRTMKTGQYMSLKRKLEGLQRNYGEGVAQQFKERYMEYREVCSSLQTAERYAVWSVMASILQEELLNEAMETAHYTDDGTRYMALDEARMDEAMKQTKEIRMAGLEDVDDEDAPSRNAAGSSGNGGDGDPDLGVLTGETPLDAIPDIPSPEELAANEE